MTRYWCAVILLVACAPLDSRAQQPIPTRAGAKKSAETTVAADTVIARVVGESITERQVLDVIDHMSQLERMPAEKLREKNRLLFRPALDQLIGLALLRKEVRDKSIAADKAEVEESFQAIVKRFPSREEFKKTLVSRGIDESALRSKIEESLRLEKALDLIAAGLPAPSDDEVGKFYDENPQLFDQPEGAHAAQIVLRLEKESTPEQKAEARKKLEQIRAEIESKATTFAEAAIKSSQDPNTAQQGGDLGFVPRELMAEPLEKAVFSAKPGTLTPIVETPLGYHLIQVIEISPAGKKPLAEVAADIRGFLENRAKQQVLQKHLVALRRRAQCEMLVTDEQWKTRNP